MTLKQFLQVGGGVLIALVFYSTPIIGIIKWPLVIISILTGAALAFLPFQERPLEKWIFAFFRAIYSPTLYYWKKSAALERFFQDEAPSAQPTQQEAVLQSYLGQAAQKGSPLQKLEEAETGFLSKVSGLFAGITSQLSGTVPAVDTAPQQVPTTPAAMKIPVSEPIRVVQENKPKLVIEERKMDAPATQTFSSSQVNPVIAGNEFISTRQAIFSPMAAPPNLPSIPNIAVGQVVDQERKIVEGAIMEIRDTAGRPVRALRSNKLGHFVIVTPLENGKYEIVTEKDGHEFSPVSFEANGNIIPPILVSGKNLHPEIL